MFIKLLFKIITNIVVSAGEAGIIWFLAYLISLGWGYGACFVIMFGFNLALEIRES